MPRRAWPARRHDLKVQAQFYSNQLCDDVPAQVQALSSGVTKWGHDEQLVQALRAPHGRQQACRSRYTNERADPVANERADSVADKLADPVPTSVPTTPTLRPHDGLPRLQEGVDGAECAMWSVIPRQIYLLPKSPNVSNAAPSLHPSCARSDAGSLLELLGRQARQQLGGCSVVHAVSGRSLQPFQWRRVVPGV